MADEPKIGVNKRRCKSYLRNEQGQFTIRIFTVICDLPINVQELILLKVAVERRLTTETFGEVHNALAVVCKLWLDLMSAPGFYERVKQQTFIADPTCRYLHTAQSVSVSGVGSTVISAVTLGNKLYVVEREEGSPADQHIFAYDLDYSDVRHQEREKRVLTCTNRQPLIVNGLDNFYWVNNLLPCPITNTLYMLAWGVFGINAKVLKVNPDTGAVLVIWEIHFAGSLVRNMSLNASGNYMVLRCRHSVYIYHTITGELAHQKNLTAEDLVQRNRFIFAALFSDDIESHVAASHAKYHDVSLYHDDHGCFLMVTKRRYMVFHSSTDCVRTLRMKDATIAERFNKSTDWYNGITGLLFSPHITGLKVVRITY